MAVHADPSASELPVSPLLDVSRLVVEIDTLQGPVRPVDGVDLRIEAGEIFGVVGESGCGKSLTALSILGLLPRPQGRIRSGSIRFEDQDLARLDERDLRRIRGNRIAMIFQEPMTSLNPVLGIGDQVAEALVIHRGLSRRDALAQAIHLLERVGIADARHRAHDFPHRLSGGMRQRVMIAMAMACRPKLLIADEPTTALDVTIQAQVLDLMDDLKAEDGVAVLLITHNFGIVAERAARVAVMYGGVVVEEASTEQLFEQPRHPYTHGLLAAVPQLGRRRDGMRPHPLSEIPGMVPNLARPAPGCAFADRCALRVEACLRERPPLAAVAPGHRVRCHVTGVSAQ
ncbi:ABC transporter ATP-binding protein [Azospirillum canadense]|uniref:ABC transporter ATP-binding protein n=1 Tax=Azospirillum canadense TaxID=403962 RepID=UPI0022275EE7|nr:ABC transporter ATP-binding protein [Azospirillum canadense]MCW2240517.1 oligopeptide/dipeptide ABC transporter ATP-binding protein [Azospirillum canadense]